MVIDEVVVLGAAVVVNDVLVTGEVVDEKDDVGRTVVVVDVKRSMEVVGAGVEVVGTIIFVVCSALVVNEVVGMMVNELEVVLGGAVVVDDVVDTSVVDEEDVIPADVDDDVVWAAVVGS